MKLLIKVMLVLCASVGLVWLAQNNTGYIVLGYDTWVVQLSMTLFGLLLLISIVLIYYLIHLLRGTIKIPGRYKIWSRQRRDRKANKALANGVVALAEGNWDKAERMLIRNASNSDMPLVHYLAAAQAAEQQNATERRDNYLKLAHESSPNAELAVGLAQAELQLSRNQDEQALANLNHLRTLDPGNTHVLKLLTRLHIYLHEWDELLRLIPELRRRKTNTPEELAHMELQAYRGKLTGVASEGTQVVKSVWESIPRSHRQNPELIETYANQMLITGDSAGVEQVLSKALKREWSPVLVRLYGMLEAENAMQQLNTAESWLKTHEEDPDLLLALGRLCIRTQLWGKARSYLETCLAINPTPEAYQLLAETLDAMGDAEAATQSCRDGLALATGNRCAMVVVESAE